MFLRRLRASGQSAQEIYADAICINQKDNKEKGHQVTLMSEIYRRAKKVLVWLAEHDRNSEMVFRTKTSGLRTPFASSGSQSSTDRVSAWTSLLSRSYWNRTWIIQEFLLAQSLDIFCSSDQMDAHSMFTKPLEAHFGRILSKNKQKTEEDSIPRSFLLHFRKKDQKQGGIFGQNNLSFPNTNIFELGYNFQHTECQMVLDHVYGLLALEDSSKTPPITPNYDISAQKLFVEICMLKLPTAAGSANKVTDKGLSCVAMLFRGLRLTFDNAEEILDIVFDNDQPKAQGSIVIATIAKAFDKYGLLKPERKQWILPETKTSQTAEHVISLMKQWQATQKKSRNWYNIHHTAQIHEPPGMTFLKLEQPIWSKHKTFQTAAMARSGLAASNPNLAGLRAVDRKY